MKDKLNKLIKSNVVYQFSCPGCEYSCVEKNELTLFEGPKEHVQDWRSKDTLIIA